MQEVQEIVHRLYMYRLSAKKKMEKKRQRKACIKLNVNIKSTFV